MNFHISDQERFGTGHFSSANKTWNILVKSFEELMKQKSTKLVRDEENTVQTSFCLTLKNGNSKVIQLQIERIESTCFLSLCTTVNFKKDDISMENINEFTNKFNQKTQIMNTSFFFRDTSKMLICKVCFKKNVVALDEATEQNIIQQSFLRVETQFTELIRQLFQKKQGNPKDILKTHRKRMSCLMQIIDKSIKDRKDSSFKPPNPVYLLNFQQPNIMIETQAIEPKKEEYSFEELFQLYRKQIKYKSSSLVKSKILQNIVIKKQKEVNDQWRASDSTYGSISKWNMEVQIYDDSIFDATSQLMQITLNKQQLKVPQIFGQFVKKQMKDERDQNSKASYKTQRAVLKYLRNQSEITIASYFAAQKTDDIGDLYTQFYPKMLCEPEFRLLDAFKIIKYLAQAIHFLQSSSVSHRDLKPQNIMVSKEMIPKVIDFGSAFIRGQNQYKSEISTILKTSKAYNLTSYTTNYKYLKSAEFDQHENFDMYAFAKISLELVKNSKRSSGSNYLMKNFDYLYHKCKEENPNDRPRGEHILLFATLLLKDYQLFKTAFP